MPNRARLAWRSFGAGDRRVIQRRSAAVEVVLCPRCSAPLERRSATRLARVLPAGADGFDLECRGCRRFLAHVRHTPASLHVLRLRRLAAAVMRA